MDEISNLDVVVHQKSCEVEGCDRYAHKKGLCVAHARERSVEIAEKRCQRKVRSRPRRIVTATVLPMRGLMALNERLGQPQVVVKEPGCQKYAREKGFCATHARAQSSICKPQPRKECNEEDLKQWPRTSGYCTTHARKHGLKSRLQGGRVYESSVEELLLICSNHKLYNTRPFHHL